MHWALGSVYLELSRKPSKQNNEEHDLLSDGGIGCRFGLWKQYSDMLVDMLACVGRHGSHKASGSRASFMPEGRLGLPQVARAMRM